MLVGLNTSLSFFGGSVLAWGIIGPALVHNNAAFGTQVAPDDPHWSGYVSFASLGSKSSTKDTPSPRYWMLWPGVLLMIVVAFTELLLQYKVIFLISKAVIRGTSRGLNALLKTMNKHSDTLEKRSQMVETDLVEDPAADHEQVKVLVWGPLLVVSIIAICVVLGVEYDMPVGMSLLTVFLAFFFTFLAVQCAGATDITPLTAASKASQIILGGATKGEHWQPEHAQRLNLLGGSLASMAAGQASDLTSDFRVGFLLRTPPDQQWYAQVLGTIVAVFLAPAMFVLFTKA